MRLRRTGSRLVLLVAFVATLLALTATVAFAAGPANKLSVDELQDKLAANGGTLHGYLRTVLRGSDIVTLSVDIRGVTTGIAGGPVDMSSLILFYSEDATITKIGGIAAGMSGSPIYVNDDGIDKVIGALSYGDVFTTGGAGFATPIDAMVNLQTEYPAAGAMRTLASPVVVDGEVKDRVMIVQSTDAIMSEPAGAIVATRPNAVFIGGLSPASRMFKAYSRVLEARGVTVVPTQGGLSAKVSGYNGDFEPGSAVAVLAARGDLWAGGIGTVTYTNPGPTADTTTVVSFGHPAFSDGESGLYLCNAWIDGVWPSTYMAYKLGRPAAVRGTLTQDRSAGVLGIDGTLPPEVSIAATATRGSDVATSLVHVPRLVADSSSGTDMGLAAASAYVAGSRIRAFDASVIPGSAVTTTTVTVSDGASTYNLVRRNVYSDRYDISMAVVADVEEMVSSFQEANANGIAHAHILSVGLETTFSAARRESEIVGLDVAGGLTYGDNKVKVSFLEYGKTATQTVEATLRIPTTVPLTGNLSASAVNSPGERGDISETLFIELITGGSSSSGIDRRTVKDVVDELSSSVDNTVISVSFQPATILGESDAATATATEYSAIETTLATGNVVSGSASKVAPKFTASMTADNPLSYGQDATVYGELPGLEGNGVVTVTGLGATKVLTVAGGSVSLVTPPLYRNTALLLTFQGSDTALPTQTTLKIDVKAKLKLSASKKTLKRRKSVTLTAKVLPKTAGGKVSFQRWNGHTWASMKTLTVPSSGKRTYKYKPTRKGTVKVRIHLSGSPTNVTSNSPSVTLKVK